jgi:lysophospholipase L1-like esterase
MKRIGASHEAPDAFRATASHDRRQVLAALALVTTGLRSCRRFNAVGSISGFGDSITHGAGASRPSHAWLNVLADDLRATGVNNQGVDGTVFQTTRNLPGNGASRWREALTGPNKTEMVFILYGYNDARSTARPLFSVGAFRDEFQAMLDGLQRAGYARHQIFLGSPPFMVPAGYLLSGPDFAGSNDTVMKVYRDAVSELADSNGLPFADVYALFKSRPELIGPDAIHPNDQGHAAIAAAFIHARQERAGPARS